jgi:hypothetical protein
MYHASQVQIAGCTGIKDAEGKQIHQGDAQDKSLMGIRQD